MKQQTPKQSPPRNWLLSLARKPSKLLTALLLAFGLGSGLFTNTASADIKAFQAAAAANANLTDQYTFEGITPQMRVMDKKGTSHLEAFASQNWNPPATTNFTTGCKPSSTAALIINSGPGGYGGSDGHSLIAPGKIWFGTNFSFEIIFRCDESPTTTTGTAGIANMGWLLSTRSDDDQRRGYLLWQGQVGTTAGDGSGLGSVMGNSAGNIANGNRVAETLVVGHWYYVAGAYTTDMSAGGGAGVTTWTNFIADLTAGDTTLTAVGHINPAGSLAPHNEMVRFGIGGRYDAYQNINPCGIDEVNLYGTGALSQADFQAHYDALRSPQNLLLNPGFETGTPGTIAANDATSVPPWSYWEGTAGGAYPNPAVGPNNGSALAWFNSGGTRHIAAQNAMDLTLDQTGLVKYHVKGQYYLPSNTAGTENRYAVRMHCIIPAGSTYVNDDPYLIDDQNLATDTLITPGSWVTKEFDWYAPAGRWCQYIAFRQYGHVAGGARNSTPDDFYMDNLVFSAEDYRNDLGGIVKDNFGSPVAGATVTLSSSLDPAIATTTTGADGSYSFPKWVPFGNSFSANASLGAYTSDGPKSLLVSAGPDGGVFPQMTLTAPAITVSGTVKRTDGTPVEASVRVTAGTYTSPPVTSTGGNFSITGLPAASSYNVVAILLGYTPNPAYVTLASASLPANIVMNPDPNYDPALLVDINAAALGIGSLNNWFNAGSLQGQFVSDGAKATVPPTVVSNYLGKKAVSFNNTKLMLSTDTTTADGSVILAPYTITGNGTYTVNALIASDHALPGEQYYFAFAHNGGSGTCSAFDYGTASAWGAVAHWGGTDMGWFLPEHDGGPSIGVWHYVTVTFDGITEKVYLDGVQVNTENKTLSLYPDNPLVLGSRFSTDLADDRSSPFNGGLASLKVYSRALTPSEVTAITSHAFTITATAGVGGSITPAGALGVDAGDQPSFTVTPALGYQIADVKVDNVSVGAVASYAFAPVAASHTIAATFQELPSQVVSGRVTDGSVGLPGATVYFKLSAPAYSTPLFTATTDATGHYSITLPPVTWHVAAGANGYDFSADSTFTVAGVPVSRPDIVLTANPNWDVLFSMTVDGVGSATPGNPTGNRPTITPTGGNMVALASPTVIAVDVDGTYTTNWEQNIYADADGYRFVPPDVTGYVVGGAYQAPIPASGVSVVAVVQPTYIGVGGEPRGEVVDLFYSDLFLAVSHATATEGQVIVDWRGYNTANTGYVIPDGQKTILCLVVQPNGDMALYANGEKVWTTSTGVDYSYLLPAGPNAPGSARTIAVGRNDFDGWSTFSGNIGDVYLYKSAISDAKRKTLQSSLATKFGITLAPTYNWVGANNGLWSILGNWNNAVPAPGHVAVLSDSASAGATVRLDTPAEVSGIEFNNLVANQSIVPTSPLNSLTLNSISVAGGSHTIGADIIAITSGLTVSGGGQLNLTGNVTLAGSGFVVSQINGAQVSLNGTGSWIDTAAAYTAVGYSPATAILTVNDNATLDWSGVWAVGIGWSAGGTGKVIQNGGTVKTPTIGTPWFNNNGPGIMMGRWDGAVSTAEYDLNGGTLIACNIYGINEVGNTVVPPAGSVIFKFNGGVLQGTQDDNLSNPGVVSEGTTNLIGNLTHAYVGLGGAKIDTAGFSCGIGQGLEHDVALGATVDGGLTKLGLGTLTLYKSSTYTGVTKANAGTLSIPIANALGGGPLEIDASASVDLAYSGTRAITGLKIAGVSKPNGVYGSAASGAANVDAHFTGTGTVTVQPAAPPVPTLPPGSFTATVPPTFTNVPTVAGYTYWLTYKNSLSDPSWTRIGSGYLSTGGVHTFTDTTTPLPANRFYRLEVQ